LKQLTIGVRWAALLRPASSRPRCRHTLSARRQLKVPIAADFPLKLTKYNIFITYIDLRQKLINFLTALRLDSVQGLHQGQLLRKRQ
jgi:hypothetical protein